LSDEDLKEAIIKAKKQVKGDLVSVLDCSQDDLGARANFGRGNASSVTAYD